MEVPDFEIRVAIIGYVSVGKSTLLNAILRDKYSEVAMRRTTAGANFFRLSERQGSKRDSNGNEKLDALEAYSEIKKDNAALRQLDGVQEKHFDIEVDEPLVEMCDDTRLVLIDIPGIDEAGSSKKYSSYVDEHWHEFDCVVLILDATKGVNSEDQLGLLKMTKTNLERSKNIPVIIVGNKVDDPDDEELKVLVKEFEVEIEKAFGIDRIEDTHGILFTRPDMESVPKFRESYSPTFLSMSAFHAFIYRSTASLTLEQFRSFDPELINRLGREEIGRRKWKHLSDAEKTKAVYDIVSDPERCEEGQTVSNWTNFVFLLSVFIGGRDRQKQLIADQVDATLRHMSSDTSLAAQLRPLYSKCTLLGSSVDGIKENFWKKLGRIQDIPLLSQPTTPAHGRQLVTTMSQLVDYGMMALDFDWKEEVKLVEFSMTHLIRLFLKNVTDNCVAFLERPAQSEVFGLEWLLIFQSLLLAYHMEDVVEAFLRERLFIASLEKQVSTKLCMNTQICPKCLSGRSNCHTTMYRCGICNGIFVPAASFKSNFRWPCGHHNLGTAAQCTTHSCNSNNPGYKLHPGAMSIHDCFTHDEEDDRLVLKESYKDFCRVEVPESLSDPNHFGHMLWLFRNFK